MADLAGCRLRKELKSGRASFEDKTSLTHEGPPLCKAAAKTCTFPRLLDSHNGKTMKQGSKQRAEEMAKGANVQV